MAIDMWALGCLITALFGGVSIFAKGSHMNVYQSTGGSVGPIRLAAAKCDLSALDSSQTWREVDLRAVALVKSLLVLDQTKRITAKQALQHAWFCQGDRQRNIEDLYEKVTVGIQFLPITSRDLLAGCRLHLQLSVKLTFRYTNT